MGERVLYEVAPTARGQEEEYEPNTGLPTPHGALEFFGGIAVMVGLGTKPVAFILSSENNQPP